MIVEGIHFLPADPPADVAWKLVAVNLSDLAAKGADPLAALLGYTLGSAEWDGAFADGLADALAAHRLALIGGDTVAAPPGAPRSLGLTAIGRAHPVRTPSRAEAQAGEALWVTGTIGAAALGLAEARASAEGVHLAAYRRPVPRLAEGRVLAPLVGAMMDVSDGLLIDTARMAAASGVAVTLALDAVPRPAGIDVLAAATAGDDYELLFTLPAGVDPPVAATRIGAAAAGEGLHLTQDGAAVPVPARLGWLHD